jgi:cytoskeletal protein CcmA (bactofilin family)
MLGKKKTENSSNPINALNVIGEGTIIKGDITSSGDLRVDGSIEGTVNTKFKFVLGISGKVNGDINAKNADISGLVIGHVNINEVLYLKASARINGDIETNKLIIESGGEFNGKCIMGKTSNKVSDINHEKTPQEASKPIV